MIGLDDWEGVRPEGQLVGGNESEVMCESRRVMQFLHEFALSRAPRVETAARPPASGIRGGDASRAPCREATTPLHRLLFSVVSSHWG